MPEDVSASVLLVDSDPEVGRSIVGYLTERAYAVEWVDNGEKAFNRLDRREFDVLVTELHVPRVDGMRLMSVAKDRNADMCVIFIAEYDDICLATEAMRQGAYDFQLKPVNLGKLEAVIQRGLDYQRLVFRQHELRRRLDESYGLGNLIGNSRQMVRVYNAVRGAAPGDAPMLIRGEAGTGKDLIAQAIHNNSGRRDEAFVKVQCAGGSADRLDRELFGLASGAVAGADVEAGRIELADRGTLYLDEAAELSAAQQERLAGLIEHRRTQRLGAARPIRADVRVIASTSRALEDLDAGFLSLLKNTIIEVPALRDRPDDIPILAHHFLREASRSQGYPVTGFSHGALELLGSYDWPGNVRELKNVIDGMVVAGRGERAMDAGDIPPYIRRAVRPLAGEVRIPIGSTIADVERVMIEETLKATGYNKETCATMLGIGLRTLYRKLAEYGMG